MATLCLRCDKTSGLTNAEMDCNLSSLNTELGTTLKTNTSFGGDVSGCYDNIAIGNSVVSTCELKITGNAPGNTTGCAPSGCWLKSDGSGGFCWAPTHYAHSCGYGLVQYRHAGCNQSATLAPISNVDCRTYVIQHNHGCEMVVNVPWTDTITTYTAGTNLCLNGTQFNVCGTVACATSATSAVVSTCAVTAINSDCLGGVTASCYARVDCPATFEGTQASGCGPHHFKGADVKLAGCCVNICHECCYYPYQCNTLTCGLDDHTLVFGQGVNIFCSTESSGAQIQLGASVVPYSTSGGCPPRYYGNWTFDFMGNMKFGKCYCGSHFGSTTQVPRWPLEINSTAPYGYGSHRTTISFNSTPSCDLLHAPSLACNCLYGVEMPHRALVCCCLLVDGMSCTNCAFCGPEINVDCAYLGNLRILNDSTLNGQNTCLCLQATYPMVFNSNYQTCYVFCHGIHQASCNIVDFRSNKVKINNYCLPTTDGGLGQFICTDGCGNLAFATVSGGSGGSSLTVQDEGTSLTTDATAINFVGKNVTASGTTSSKTVCVHGDTVCITNGCTNSANVLAFGLSKDWKEAELVFHAQCRFPVCTYPAEPRIESVWLRSGYSYTNCFDYNANTTNNTSGCRCYINTGDLMPDVYVADETIVRYHFWKVPVGTGNTCSRIHFEASYVGGYHGYAGTGRCDRVFLSGRSDTIICNSSVSNCYWCILFCAGAHYITRDSYYYYCTSYIGCAEWALKVIT